MAAPSLASVSFRRSPLLRITVVAAVLALATLGAGCRQKWDITARPAEDKALEAEFFAGLDSEIVPDIPEPASLRPCCIFANDVGVQVGSYTVPGYEVRSVIGVDELGTHHYNHGAVALQPRGGDGIVADEKSGILYTCRGGFIDIAHVRDNADRTLFLVSRIARLATSGGEIHLSDEGGERHILLRPLDPALVEKFGLREVGAALAEWLDYQLSVWHEIATWYGWSATGFSERPSAFSPEDLYSNLLGVRIAGIAIRRQSAASEIDYDRSVTSLLHDAIDKLGALPKDASRRAFEYVDGIWWDSTKRVPDNLLVRHRNLDLGPFLRPWKLIDAQSSDVLRRDAKEFDVACHGDWSPLPLSVANRIGGAAFRDMATLEIKPAKVVTDNGIPLESGSDLVTPEDFQSIVDAIAKAADEELGPGVAKPAARPGESSRYGQKPDQGRG
ncbi:MAG TPA: DUF4056 domain-containing protein [Candidatus Binatia bacterium]